MPFHSTEKHGNHGFSFIELAIVLTIFGLLVGAIMQGKALMRASELQDVIAQLRTFTVADQAFREKYQAVAGDMSTATTLWGAADPLSAADCMLQLIFVGAPDNKTCNGNGTGFVETSGDTYAERPLYWQHLSNAGLISGKYSGFETTGGSCCFRTTSNMPAGKIKTSLWSPNSSIITPFSYQLGGQTAPTGGMPAGMNTGNIFTPEELWSLDTKIDDSRPLTGMVVAGASGANNCWTGSGTTSTYVLTYSAVACFAYFFINQE